ncbi:MAG: Hpt domain-containing protein [Pirellula sp.]
MSNEGFIHPKSTAPIYSEFASDPDFRDLLTEFVSNMPDRIQAILDAERAGDRDTLRRCVHQLKGSCGGYGFSALTDDATLLERSLDRGCSLGDIEHQLEAFTFKLSCLTADTADPDASL